MNTQNETPAVSETGRGFAVTVYAAEQDDREYKDGPQDRQAADLVQQPAIARAVEHVHALGVRATLELVCEIASARDGRSALARALDQYRTLNPRLLAAWGGDRLTPPLLDLVPGYLGDDE